MNFSSSQQRQQPAQPYQDHQDNRCPFHYTQCQIPPRIQDYSSYHFIKCNNGCNNHHPYQCSPPELADQTQPPGGLAIPKVTPQQAQGGGDAGKATDSGSVPVPDQQDLHYAALALNQVAAAFAATWAQITQLTGAIGRAGVESLLASLLVQQWQAMAGPESGYHGQMPNHNLAAQSGYRGQGNVGNHPMRTGSTFHDRGVTEEMGRSDHFQQHGDHGETKSDVPSQAPASQNGKVAINNKQRTQGARCDLCKVDLTSLEMVEEHENGKKHKKNLQRSQQPEIADRPVAELHVRKIPVGDSNPNPNPKVTLRPEDVVDIEKSKNSQPGNLPTVFDGHGNKIGIQQPNGKTGKTYSSRNAKSEGLVCHPGNRTRGLKRKRDGDRGGKRMNSVDAPRSQKPPKPKIAVPFACNLCKVRCHSKENFDEHLSSKKHISKQKPPKARNSMPFKCNLCNVRCFAKEVFDDRLSDKKHTSRLKQVGAHKSIGGPVGLQAVYPPSSDAQNPVHQQSHQAFHSPQGSYPPLGDLPPQSHSAVPAATGIPALGLPALHSPRSVAQNPLLQQVPQAFGSPQGPYPPSRDVPPENRPAATAATGTLAICSPS